MHMMQFNCKKICFDKNLLYYVIILIQLLCNNVKSFLTSVCKKGISVNILHAFSYTYWLCCKHALSVSMLYRRVLCGVVKST